MTMTTGVSLPTTPRRPSSSASAHIASATLITVALDAGVALRDVQEAASHPDPRRSATTEAGDAGPPRHLHRGHLRRRRLQLSPITGAGDNGCRHAGSRRLSAKRLGSVSTGTIRAMLPASGSMDWEREAEARNGGVVGGG
jgi:hypothetical protein